MAPKARYVLVQVLSLALAASLGLLVAPSAGAAQISNCFGRAPTLVGTSGADVLTGTAGADVIRGLGGHDVIRGLGGNDRLCGGSGSDELFGGDGQDRLAGETDPVPEGEPEFPAGDVLAGGAGDDVLFGGSVSGDDSSRDVVSFRGATGAVEVDLVAGMSHGQGEDQIAGVEGIIGTAHDDELRAIGGGEVHAGAGGDRLVSAPGPEFLLGGPGADSLILGAGDFGWGDNGPDVLRSRGAGEVTAFGEGGSDTFLGGRGEDTFYDLDDTNRAEGDVARGGGGRDIIGLGGGDDVPYGGSGADAIIADPGKDRVYGGRGADTYSGGSSSSSGFKVDLRRGIASGAGTGHDRLHSIANIDGTAYADVLIGNAGANIIFGGPGNDRMSGGVGDDDLDGHDGQDEAVGGPGSDRCVAEERRGCES